MHHMRLAKVLAFTRCIGENACYLASGLGSTRGGNIINEKLDILPTSGMPNFKEGEGQIMECSVGADISLANLTINYGGSMREFLVSRKCIRGYNWSGFHKIKSHQCHTAKFF